MGYHLRILLVGDDDAAHALRPAVCVECKIYEPRQHSRDRITEFICHREKRKTLCQARDCQVDPSQKGRDLALGSFDCLKASETRLTTSASLETDWGRFLVDFYRVAGRHHSHDQAAGAAFESRFNRLYHDISRF